MKRSLVLGLAFLAGQLYAASFTGDAAVDFAGLSTAEAIDDGGVPDVGLPGNAPAGTISGFDFERILFSLDLNAQELLVGIDYFGIAGDADGDGGEGTTSPWLAANGGLDLPNLGGSESICIAFDVDMDGNFDVIAGVSSLTDSYVVADYLDHPFGINFSFGTPIPLHEGAHAIGPDFELALTGVPGLFEVIDNTICFNYAVFSGSIQDDGIGEDLIDNQVGTICVTDDTQVEAELPVSFNTLSAWPNPFNPTTRLQVELAETGMVNLSVFDLMGREVAVLANGMMESGNHSLSFDASGLASGLYLARLQTESGVAVERLLLTR